MQIQEIVAELKTERRRLDTAIAALESLGSVDGTRSIGKKRKGISAAGRRRISQAQKARWAAKRKKAA